MSLPIPIQPHAHSGAAPLSTSSLHAIPSDNSHFSFSPSSPIYSYHPEMSPRPSYNKTNSSTSALSAAPFQLNPDTSRRSKTPTQSGSTLPTLRVSAAAPAPCNHPHHQHQYHAQQQEEAELLERERELAEDSLMDSSEDYPGSGVGAGPPSHIKRTYSSATATHPTAPLDPRLGTGSGGGVGLGGEEPEDELRRGPPTSDTPGGDCKSLCIRHQRMANGKANLMLQQSIESLNPAEQASVNTIWSLFSSSPSRRRLLILQGLLTIACPSQLTFLQSALTLEMRLDPLLVLPREVSLKLLSYLDAISLGRAAQVNTLWRDMADDDLLWRTMCEQHIERKCEKCGWGLPLLGERRRKARAAINALPARMAEKNAAGRVGGGVGGRNERMADDASSVAAELADDSPDPLQHAAKKSKTASPAPSRASSPPATATFAITTLPPTRPWKSVYCERLAIERNWRKGTCSSTVLTGHTDSITCLQVAEDLQHPNYPVLMTGSWDRSVRIWNLETGKEVGVLRGHTRGVRALQFDALKLVTGSMDSTLKIWNWRTGECMRTLRGHTDAVICLSYDKQLLVSGSADSTIRVWDFGTGEGFTLIGHTEWVNSVALWDSKAGCIPTPTTPSGLDGGSAPLTTPELSKASAKGKFLFSASDDMTIRVWDLYTRECVRVLKGHVAQVQSLRVITSDDAPVPQFPISSPQPLAAEEEEASGGREYRAPTSSASTPTSVPSPDSADEDDVATPRRPVPRAGFFASVPAPTLIPTNDLPYLDFQTSDRPLIISASLDNTIKLWDVESGECKRTMFGHIEGVWDVDVDKLRIVSASHDRTLKIWDKESGKCLHTLVGHTSAVTAVKLQDQYVITGSDDCTAMIWKF